MKCKDYKILMMDFLYDEIRDEDKAKLENHLKNCRECRQEFAELKAVPGFLNNWKEEPAPVQVTFTTEENSLLNFLGKLVPDFGMVKKAGLGFAAILFIMALFNTKIEVNDGNFTFQTSLLSKKPSELTEVSVSPEVMEQLKYENFKLTTQLLEAYEAQDEKKTLNMMSTLATEIRKERNQEYKELISTVNHAYKANDFRIQQTSHTVDEIIDILNTSAQIK